MAPKAGEHPRTPPQPGGTPPVRRHITGHDSAGKSIFLPSPELSYFLIPGAGGMTRSYATTSIPAILKDTADVKAYLNPDGRASKASFNNPFIVMPESGACVNVVELKPGGVTRMHQTESVDFSICVGGRLEMELDGGEKVELGPGDHVIQRGTMHQWRNLSDTEPARMIGVALPWYGSVEEGWIPVVTAVLGAIHDQEGEEAVMRFVNGGKSKGTGIGRKIIRPEDLIVRLLKADGEC